MARPRRYALQAGGHERAGEYGLADYKTMTFFAVDI